MSPESIRMDVHSCFVDIDAGNDKEHIDSVILPQDILLNKSPESVEMVLSNTLDFMRLSPFGACVIPGYISLKNPQGDELSKIMFVKSNREGEFLPVDKIYSLDETTSQYDISSKKLLYIADDLKNISDKVTVSIKKVAPHESTAKRNDTIVADKYSQTNEG